eukprot:scaffold6323_cov121-Isochrysis_galbana.AAC.4
MPASFVFGPRHRGRLISRCRPPSAQKVNVVRGLQNTRLRANVSTPLMRPPRAASSPSAELIEKRPQLPPLGRAKVQLLQQKRHELAQLGVALLGKLPSVLRIEAGGEEHAAGHLHLPGKAGVVCVQEGDGEGDDALRCKQGHHLFESGGEGIGGV